MTYENDENRIEQNAILEEFTEAKDLFFEQRPPFDHVDAEIFTAIDTDPLAVAEVKRRDINWGDHASIIINKQKYDAMEAESLRLDCQIWFIVQCNDGLRYAVLMQGCPYTVGVSTRRDRRITAEVVHIPVTSFIPVNGSVNGKGHSVNDEP